MVMVKRGKARKGNIHSLGTEIVFTVLEAGAYLFNLVVPSLCPSHLHSFSGPSHLQRDADKLRKK